jgi:hypothetical protein
MHKLQHITCMNLFYSPDKFGCVHPHQGGTHHNVIQNIMICTSLVMVNTPQHVRGVK